MWVPPLLSNKYQLLLKILHYPVPLFYFSSCTCWETKTHKEPYLVQEHKGESDITSVYMRLPHCRKVRGHFSPVCVLCTKRRYLLFPAPYDTTCTLEYSFTERRYIPYWILLTAFLHCIHYWFVWTLVFAVDAILPMMHIVCILHEFSCTFAQVDCYCWICTFLLILHNLFSFQIYTIHMYT